MVEYNELEFYLSQHGMHDQSKREIGHGDSDLSPFPGNVNIVCIQLQPYLETMNRSQGLLNEFVNPKLGSGTEFASSCRLECMF